MSAEACQTAKYGKVPALKTLLTNPATRAAIDQLFKVPGLSDVSILRLLVVYCTISLLIVAFPTTTACLCAVHAWMRVVGGCCT